MKRSAVSLLFFLLICVHAQEADIRAAMQAQLDVPKLRSILTYDENPDANAVTEYVAPNSFRMASATSEMIVIADKTYQKEDGAAWEVLDVNMGKMIASVRNSLNSVVYSNVQALSDENLKGKACKVYSYVSDFHGLVQQNKLWVDKVTGLPLRLESTSDITVGGKKINGATEFEYDDTLVISAPIQ
jgi:hypothetical protein